MHKLSKLFMIVAFFVGFLLSASVSESNHGSHYFAGYKRNAENKGSRAYIGYKNPPVYSGSGEWVMVGEGTGSTYFQVGWLKEAGEDTAPTYFAERGCAGVCRYEWETVPSGTTHHYEVTWFYTTENRWCAKVDGTCRLNSPDSLVGMGSSAAIAYWSGETWDSRDQLGGTASSHLRFSEVQYKGLNGNWVIPDRSLLVSITTGGTRYRASNGLSGSSVWIDNWTE